MRYWPLVLIGSELPAVRDGFSGSIRSIFPSATPRFCALPPGSTWLAPTSLALPPSPVARYRYPSGPYCSVPPLWLLAFLPKDMITRRVDGSTTFGSLDDIFHSVIWF